MHVMFVANEHECRLIVLSIISISPPPHRQSGPFLLLNSWFSVSEASCNFTRIETGNGMSICNTF